MKTYAVHLKNVAVLLLLLSLFALLLPVCRITADQQMVSVSGAELIGAGIHAGCEYVKNGALAEDYLVKDGLTWGNLKSGMQSAMEAQGMETKSDFMMGMVILFIGMLPVILCFLAMVFTFFARSKGAMVLPTLFLLAACLENTIIMVHFFAIQKAVLSENISSTVQFSLLMGYYLFAILCGLSLLILLFLWISGGFKLQSEDSNEHDSKKRGQKNRGDRKKKKERLFQRKKRHRRKGRRNKRACNKKSGQSNTKRKEQDNRSFEEDMGSASGRLIGISGIYQDVKCNLNETADFKVILGTTKESAPFLDAKQADGCGLTIEYSMDNKKYRIQSGTSQHVLIKYKNGRQELLKNREIKILEESVTVYVEDIQHAIRLM